MATDDAVVVGWDVGGAHLKAALLQGGALHDVAQWACPLWQGLDRLEAALQSARERWPGALAAPATRHAITMTGEMTDLFADREDGVRRIAAALERALAPAPLRFFAGDAGWCTAAEAPAHWQAIASANWLATARHAARRLGTGVLVDIGSTTTDLIAFAGGRVASASRSDAQRLASGELAYHGVVRTPLCALAPRIDWRGRPHNVMNEFFATSADVYRLTGELDPAHDLYPCADGAPKTTEATQQRLARMIGLDRRDGSDADWLAFAHAWRAAQVQLLAGELRRVLDAQALTAQDALFVGAGCGDFLLPAVVAAAGADAAAAPRLASYGREVARLHPHAVGGPQAAQQGARLCAPSVAVAALFVAEGG